MKKYIIKPEFIDYYCPDADAYTALTEDDVELCVIDYYEKEICVFHVLNARQLEAVKDYSFDKTTTNINN